MARHTSRFRMVTRTVCAILALGSFSLAGQTHAQELGDIKNDLRGVREILQRLVDQKTTTDVTIQQLRKEVNDLNDEIVRLRRELADVRNRTANTPSTSGFRGLPSTSMSISPAPTATIRLVNTHAIDMTAYINGAVIAVPPGMERPVTVPAGAVNYMVYQVPEPMRTRMLVPNETLTLTLFPR